MAGEKKTGSKNAWGWSILYIVLVVAGWQLAGIGGGIGAILIAWGVSRTVRNPDYSTGKKVLYSILYVIGGLVIAFLIVVVIMGVILGLS